MNSLKFLNSYIPEKQRERGDFFFFFLTQLQLDLSLVQLCDLVASLLLLFYFILCVLSVIQRPGLSALRQVVHEG